ncbi:MAG: alginate lyase family protein [Tepidisphaeraceae bacterium]
MHTNWTLSAIMAVTFCAAGARGASIDVRQLDRDRVLDAADAYLKEEPVTVTAASSPRSAGGRHDFFSEGDYWWPDPQSTTAPYVQRDGMTNPDNFVAHRHAMVRMSQHVAALTAAYRITGDEKYAKHAIKHLKGWFVDEPTRMSPHLLYAQAIQGRHTGRGIGIIDTLHLIEPARAASLLQQAGLLKGDDLTAVKKWFADYLTWMTTHKYGLDEMNAENNHGTCWVAQVAAFASFTGDEEKLAMCRQRYKDVLLPTQMAEDGSFPRELKRTKPYGYSLFNADAMATVCRILSTKDDNLWTYETPDGKSMRKGVAWLYPFIKDKSSWPFKQDVMYWNEWPVRSPVLLFGGLAYDESKYLELWKTLEANPTNEEVLRNLPIRQPVLWVE